jgi:hypothetical protein
MNSLISAAASYFSPRTKDFWRWSEEYRVIELTNGRTICYTDDLIDLLKSLQPYGLPNLEVVLLILTACQKEFISPSLDYLHKPVDINLRNTTTIGTRPHEMLNYGLIGMDEYYEANPLLYEEINTISILLKKIHDLPNELRSGYMRVNLLKKILSLGKPVFSAEAANIFIKEFESGRININISLRSDKPDDQLESILEAFKGLSGIKDLEVFIRIGLEEIPLPLPMPIETPENKPGDLLEELAKEKQTASLAFLTKRLIAALNIPPFTDRTSNQPLGGISDITNRGNLDRLLLTELANDDDTLVSRLVNNEALYYRRETPPDPQIQERVILVDGSLRMWGTPRFVALSAALGFVLKTPLKVQAAVYSLGREVFGPTTLSTKNEVVTFLEHLSPAINCKDGLISYFQQTPKSPQQATFFITAEETLVDREFSQQLAELSGQLDYMLVVNRFGKLQFWRLYKNRRSLISNLELDLNELLSQPKSDHLPRQDDKYPIAYSEASFPLLLPTPKYGTGKKRRIIAANCSVLAVMDNGELWFWAPNKGARSVAENVPKNEYWLLENESHFCAVIGKKDIRVFIIDKIDTNELDQVIEINKTPISDHSDDSIGDSFIIDRVIYNAFKLKNSNDFIFVIQKIKGNPYVYYRLDVSNHTIRPISEFPEQGEIIAVSPYRQHEIYKTICENGYNILSQRRTNQIFVNGNNNLKFKNLELKLMDGNLMLVLNSGGKHSFIKSAGFKWIKSENRTFQLYRATWENGSTAFLDSRGFLHLLSKDGKLPELCILLIQDKPLAAYASNGEYAGNDFFIPFNDRKKVSPAAFYQYIQLFVDQLQS